MSGASSEVVALGIGSAGIRIVSELSKKQILIDKFAYISCDKSDLESVGDGERLLIEGPVQQKLTPPIVRGLAMPYQTSVERLVENAKIVFVVAGLGGATGSGLAPVVAQTARRRGASTISVAMMPFDFERKLLFYAGLALKRLRSASNGVVVIDNDILLKASGDSTLMEIYSIANEEVVKALSCLLSKPSDSSIPIGLNKVLGTILQEGYSLLGSASSGSVDKTEEALSQAVIGISRCAEAKEASRAVVVLSGDASLSATETSLAVKRLGSMMGNQELDVEYTVGYGKGSQVLVSVLASGFKATKYDQYDPLGAILGNNIIDDGMDSALASGLERLTACD